MAQQIGGALGDAVIGVVFFGAGPTAEGAFTASLWVLVGVAVAVAGLTRLLRPSAAAGWRCRARGRARRRPDGWWVRDQPPNRLAESTVR